MKKSIIKKVLSFAIMCSVILTSTLFVSASENVDQNVDQEVLLGYVDVDELLQNGNTEIISRASGSVGFTSLGAGKYSKSTMTTSLSKGQSYSYSVSFSPTAQKIKVGVVNANTGAFWGTAELTGSGTKTGTLANSSRPAGTYYWTVYAVSSNTKSVSGGCTFTK